MIQSAESPKFRTRRCAVCRNRFTPRSMTHRACSADCAVTLAEISRKKVEKKADRRKRENLKTLSQLAKEAEQYVNKYVRLRDANRSCISCDRPASWDGQWHASHFKSVGANSALRFNLWNIHKACSICNSHLSGNIGEYAKRLPFRIGQERFDFLQSHERTCRYSREYLIRLKQVAMKACRRMERKLRHE